MKKQMIAYIAILVVIVVAITIFFSTRTDTVNNQTDLTKIQDEFNLDIIVNLGNFSKEDYDEEKLLDVAMQLAEKNNLFNEFSDETTFIQYVSREDLHSIIKDFTGIELESPIEIEDFYYLYDSENDYYYYRPASPSYFKVDSITSTKVHKDTYDIKCVISETIDSEIVNVTDVSLSITSCPENNWIKYKVNEISLVK